MDSVIAELKAWDTDLDGPPYVPADPHDFILLFMAAIGPKDQMGAEWFDFVVCTPTFIARDLRGEAPGAPTTNRNLRYQFGRFLLIVNEWEEELVIQAVRELRAGAPAGDWRAVSNYLTRFGSWEYDHF